MLRGVRRALVVAAVGLVVSCTTPSTTTVTVTASPQAKVVRVISENCRRSLQVLRYIWERTIRDPGIRREDRVESRAPFGSPEELHARTTLAVAASGVMLALDQYKPWLGPCLNHSKLS
jgi:hypothetical protein